MPAFEPTDEQRRLVRGFSGFGVTHEDIAGHLEIDAKTLRKHFRRELDRGSVEVTVKVAQSLFQMATQGKNVAAAIFWMKARAGWRERHEVKVTTAIEDLSDADLDRGIHLLRQQIAEIAIEGEAVDVITAAAELAVPP